MYINKRILGSCRGPYVPPGIQCTHIVAIRTNLGRHEDILSNIVDFSFKPDNSGIALEGSIKPIRTPICTHAPIPLLDLIDHHLQDHMLQFCATILIRRHYMGFQAIGFIMLEVLPQHILKEDALRKHFRASIDKEKSEDFPLIVIVISQAETERSAEGCLPEPA